MFEKKTIINQICDCIEKTFDISGRNMSGRIIIFPVGDIAMRVLDVMKNIYSVEPAYMIDNHKCRFSSRIHDISLLKDINRDEYVLFLASTNTSIYNSLKTSILEFFPPDRIIEFEDMVATSNAIIPEFKTEIGKYSYGPICRNHPWIESIGSFCSFAPGVDYVTNHEYRYITTHPIIYGGKNIEGYEYPFECFRLNNYYIPGIEPKAEMIKKQKRATIGNDVWLGQNVIVTNSSNIGNGVIAAAGAVITKDVPDFAVLAGVPAKIIRYRYSQSQIQAINAIAWWNWSDDQIRNRYDDFYLPIDDFISKYSE